MLSQEVQTQERRITHGNVKPIPEGYTTVTTSITLNDAAQAIEFYKRALGATERARIQGPDGKIMHAETQIGSSILMLHDTGRGSRSMRIWHRRRSERGPAGLAWNAYLRIVNRLDSRSCPASTRT